MLHGFNLVTGSVFGCDEAKEVLKYANRLVTGTQSATVMWQHVKDLAALNTVPVGLHTSGATRFSSQYDCLNSVDLHRNVFQQLINDNEKAKSIPVAKGNQTDLKRIIKDNAFWTLLRPLKEFMLPFQKVRSRACCVHLLETIAVHAQGNTLVQVVWMHVELIPTLLASAGLETKCQKRKHETKLTKYEIRNCKEAQRNYKT
jgi:hypothetical protein